MIFGAKTLYTTNEILDSILSTGDIKDSTGAVSITKKDGRKTVATGKIFFRNELIYAVEISNYETPIGRRVESGGLVDQDDLEGIFRRVGSKSSPRIVDQLLVGQLISEKNINGYVKEHFIEALGYILSWDNCSGEWHPNVTTNDFVMPHVSLDKIRAILENRASLKKDFSIAVRSFFKSDEIDNLTFVSTIQNHSEYPAEIRALLRRADGEFTVADIARDTGISNFAVFQSVISLWKKNLLILRLGGIDLSFSSLQEAVKPASEEVKPALEDTLVPLASEADSLDNKEVDPEEESIKAAEEVTKEFVNDTKDYADEPEDEVVTNDSVTDEVSDEEVPSVEDEIEFTDVSYTDEPAETDDFITEDDIDEAPETREAEDEFILTEEDSDIFASDDIAHEEAAEVEEEPASEFVPHFENLPAPIHSVSTDAPVTDEEPTDESDAVVEFETFEDYESAVEPELDVNPVPIVEAKKEEPVPTPANLSEATLTIATFTQRLNELQTELSEVSATVTESKVALEASEDNLQAAEKNLREAQLAVEAAQNGYEACHAEVEKTEANYAATVSDIEALIQSFKFNP